MVEMITMKNYAASLKWFFIHRTPLATFMMCLASFAIVLISLACAVSVYDLKNPDTQWDWNTFLDRLATYELCLTKNKTAAYYRGSLYHQDDNDPSFLDLTRDSGSGTVQTVSVRSNVVFTLPQGKKIGNEALSVKGQFTGRQLGLRGLRKSYLVNVSIDLPPMLGQKIKCDSSSKTCKSSPLSSCIHFAALSDAFPKTKQPGLCANNPQERRTVFMETLHARSFFRSLRCRDLSKLHVKHKSDPGLTVMLSQNEKEVARNHLLSTSYILLAFLLSFFIYAMASESRTSYSIVHLTDDDEFENKTSF